MPRENYLFDITLIPFTKLVDGKIILVGSRSIDRIEVASDTMLHMTTGRVIPIKETADQATALIRAIQKNKLVSL